MDLIESLADMMEEAGMVPYVHRPGCPMEGCDCGAIAIKAELDRLRAENADLRKLADEATEHVNHMLKELYRIRPQPHGDGCPCVRCAAEAWLGGIPQSEPLCATCETPLTDPSHVIGVCPAKENA